MNEILDSISSLSDTDLRKEMVNAGLPLTPITQSTRRIFQQRLANKRFSLLRNIQDDNTVEVPTKDTTETVDTGDDIESGDPCVEVRSPEPHSPVFVVFMSMENETSSSTSTMEVFHDQVSALKFLSQNKNGRLMRFENRGKAE
uniref:LEM domain-containing protein n=1 Tax=Ciona savignyi TaxID=51511 RepID=H2Z5K3_CIOSA